MQGVEVSKHPENIAFHSVLLFHDSIEMFLKLAATYKNVKSDKFSFIEYWNNIPELTLKGSMESLNKVRVNLKHYGQIPSKTDLEFARVNSTDFFTQNTKIIFEKEFAEISLFDLIKYEKTKKSLINSQSSLKEGKFSDSVEASTIAFYELLGDYQKSKSEYYSENTFQFYKKIRLFGSDFESEVKSLKPTFDQVIDKVNESLDSLSEGLTIIALGINYRKYTKFKKLTPHAIQTNDGEYHLSIYGDRIWDYMNCQFLIDFVLESAITVQDFDYELDSIRPSSEDPFMITKVN